MDHFSYVMTLVSIVLALGLTHILSALGTAVHRMRGHGASIRLESVYLCWVGYVLIWTVSFWWWEFKLNELPIQWSYSLYLFLIGYSIALFLTAVVLVPKDMEGMADSYAYFMAGRRWFLSAVLLLLAIDFGDTLIKGAEWTFRSVYVLSELGSAAACVLAMVSERRRVQLVVAWAMFLYQVYFIWDQLGILGQWTLLG